MIAFFNPRQLRKAVEAAHRIAALGAQHHPPMHACFRAMLDEGDPLRRVESLLEAIMDHLSGGGWEQAR